MGGVVASPVTINRIQIVTQKHFRSQHSQPLSQHTLLVCDACAANKRKIPRSSSLLYILLTRTHTRTQKGMVFGWGSPRKAEGGGVSREEATVLFARIASGKSCTPSEGSSGASEDSKGRSSADDSSSLTSPASVNQSNMMPNPNQKRAAQQRCETARATHSAFRQKTCPTKTLPLKKTPSCLFFVGHPFVFLTSGKRRWMELHNVSLHSNCESIRMSATNDDATHPTFHHAFFPLPKWLPSRVLFFTKPPSRPDDDQTFFSFFFCFTQPEPVDGASVLNHSNQ